MIHQALYQCAFRFLCGAAIDVNLQVAIGSAHMPVGATSYKHVVTVLQELHWLPIVSPAQFKMLIITYKSLYGLEHVYLKDHHILQVLLQLRGESESQWMGTMERILSIIAPWLWNSLPVTICLGPSLC